LLGSAEAYNKALKAREITAKFGSVDPNIVELFDSKSGDYLGTRSLSTSNNFFFRDFDWQFDGAANTNDSYKLSINSRRSDDASNLNKILNLADYSEKSGRGGYSNLYNEIVTATGYNSRAAEQSLETSQIIHDVALDRKSMFSGVDLDTEAARLLEQQQAYQALAKVLSTAKELVDTLLRAF
jgi:flagellar hook-associated protein 1 FlgK